MIDRKLYNKINDDLLDTLFKYRDQMSLYDSLLIAVNLVDAMITSYTKDLKIPRNQGIVFVIEMLQDLDKYKFQREYA
ncbi:MAG: hypothetical protein ACR2F1_07910 [Nitrososphaeraceae archaeon]